MIASDLVLFFYEATRPEDVETRRDVVRALSGLDDPVAREALALIRERWPHGSGGTDNEEAK